MQRTVRHPKQVRILNSIWTPIVLGIILIVLMLVIRFPPSGAEKQAGDPDLTYQEILQTVQLEGVLTSILGQYGLTWTASPDLSGTGSVWRVSVPPGLPFPTIHLAIQDSVRSAGGRILSSRSDPAAGRLILSLGCADSCDVSLVLQRPDDVHVQQDLIALIIDDFGDKWDQTTRGFLELGTDLTLSVIPGLGMSAAVSRSIQQAGFEILLHLPMEPVRGSYRNSGTMILTGMDQDVIRQIIQRSLDDVPGAAGVNNHMGSKATSDRTTMVRVLEEIRQKQLYFVDSRTIASTVALEVARSMDLPCVERDVFIDVESEGKTIHDRLRELADEAKSRGYAVGIGHCRKRTLDVLREEIPRLKAQGFLFVRVSAILPVATGESRRRL